MIRTIAIHLPQFHPIPENDSWWGKGFTEWTNVAKAKPLFRGHYQPHIPADLGFYDLRLEEARVAQSELAKEFGFYGFCYYHYWFHGTRLLQHPVDEILRTGKPDFPFMLCWANGSWTRTWEGSDDVLIEQTYSPEDDLDHIRFLLEIFRDPRYIRVNNKPVFAVCRTEMMPDAAQTAGLWKEEARKAGFEDIYLLRFEMYDEGYPASQIGFDASAEFQPDWKHFPEKKRPVVGRLLNSLGIRDPYSRNHVYDYDEFVKKMLQKSRPGYKLFPAVTPGWDNSPRKTTNAIIMRNSTPGQFKHWFREVINRFTPYSPEENFVFVNAWNEWAEGNHMEPDLKWGRSYLDAIKEVTRSIKP